MSAVSSSTRRGPPSPTIAWLGSLAEIRDGDHVLVVGAILAAAAGVAYNTTAAIQKHEVVRVGAPPRRLLPALLLRPWWLAALLLDLAAWTAQTAAMALAPLVVVVPLLALGAALLVVLGVGWLGERFGRAELLAVALIAVGVALVVLAGGAVWLVQVGFQRANAASVTAAMTALESLGPILAGFLLYRERWPAGGHGVLLLAGALLAVAGLTALAARGHAQVGGAAPQRT